MLKLLACSILYLVSVGAEAATSLSHNSAQNAIGAALDGLNSGKFERFSGSIWHRQQDQFATRDYFEKLNLLLNASHLSASVQLEDQLASRTLRIQIFTAQVRGIPRGANSPTNTVVGGVKVRCEQRLYAGRCGVITGCPTYPKYCGVTDFYDSFGNPI